MTMLTLKEARKIQKERESKALILFVLFLGLTGLITFLLTTFTNVFSIHTAFYLIPIILVCFSIKKTKIYLFLRQKEFTGKVVRLDVYPVKVGKIKGEHTYESGQGETLEVSLIVDNGEKSRMIELYAGELTAKIAEGTKLSLLRFIDQPIIID